MSKWVAAQRLGAACALVLALSGSAHAQGATLGSVAAGVEAVRQKLDQVVASAGPEAKAVADRAKAALDEPLRELRTVANHDMDKRLARLPLPAQTLAARLQATAADMDALLEARMQCGADDTGLLISGIRTLSLQLTNSLPFIRADMPYLRSFRFGAHRPGVVPPEAGTAVVYGLSVRATDPRPDAKLYDGSRNLIQELEVRPGPEANSFTTSIDKRPLSARAGECLSMSIIPRKSIGLVFKRVEELPAMDLPLCVPKTAAVSGCGY